MVVGLGWDCAWELDKREAILITSTIAEMSDEAGEDMLCVELGLTWLGTSLRR